MGRVEAVADGSWRSQAVVGVVGVVRGQASRGAGADRQGALRVVGAGGSAGRRGERFEPGEGGGEVARPGPGCLEVRAGSAGVEGESGDVQQPVAQAFGLGFGKLAGQQQPSTERGALLRRASGTAREEATRVNGAVRRPAVAANVERGCSSIVKALRRSVVLVGCGLAAVRVVGSVVFAVLIRCRGLGG